MKFKYYGFHLMRPCGLLRQNGGKSGYDSFEITGAYFSTIMYVCATIMCVLGVRC